ncbi:hypothetical protein H4Q26_002250, partial [Puccinia striiformis f. sp. tritici PST-130]
TRAKFAPEVFFGLTKAEAIVASIDQVLAGEDHDTSLMEWLIGGEEFDGQIECLSNAISSWMKSDYYKLYVWDQARMDDFIDVEGRRVCKEMVAELAKHWARAEGRRLAEQAAKAIAKRAEKARKTKEKAEKRLRVADDRKREKKLMLEERAAEQLHIATQKKATRARETQQRAAAKAEEKARASKQAKRTKQPYEDCQAA